MTTSTFISSLQQGEDSEVCEIRFARLQDIIGQLPSLVRHFHRLMSQEIMREQNVLFLMGNMRAEQRFAVFLTNLSLRYAERGFSPTRSIFGCPEKLLQTI